MLLLWQRQGDTPQQMILVVVADNAGIYVAGIQVEAAAPLVRQHLSASALPSCRLGNV